MTIKEFSTLCGCNPQTLRYYDRQGLLKPVRVDAWTGYRFYREEQAVTFVKIKSLQRAGFTIGEIKRLLNRPDLEILRAFAEKAAEAERRLEEIKAIQRAYQAEINSMKNKIEALQTLLRAARVDYDPTEEFGISHEEAAALLGQMEAWLAQIAAEGDYSRFEYNDYAEAAPGAERAYLQSCLNNPAYTVIFQRHGWQHVRDFYAEMPTLNEEKGYLLLFEVTPAKPNKTAFANTMLGLCCAGIESTGQRKLGCTVVNSSDGENHFWLVQYSDKT